MQNELAYAIRDGFPVTDLHTLIIPKRHIATYFDLYQPEINACNRLMSDTNEEIEGNDQFVSGIWVSGRDNGRAVLRQNLLQPVI
jgi:ATP adenylyltransferase